MPRKPSATSSSPSGTILYSSSDTNKNETLCAMSSPSQSVIDRNVENESFEEIRYWVWFENAEKVLFEPKKEFLVAESKNPDSDVIVKADNIEKDYQSKVMTEKVVTKGSKRVKKEVNDEKFGNLGVCDSDIDNSDNINKDDQSKVMNKKVVTKGSKRVKKEVNDEKFENLGVCDSDIDNSDNINKDDQSKVMTKKVVTKGSKRVKKEVNGEKFGNLGAGDGADSESQSLKNIVSCSKKGFLVASKVGEAVSNVSKNPDSDFVNADNFDKDGKRRVVKNNTNSFVSCSNEFSTHDSDIVNDVNFSKDEVRRVVTKKVVNKGNKRVKKDENDEKFGNLGAGDEGESERPDNIVSCLDEIQTLNSDIEKNVNIDEDGLRKLVVKGNNKRPKKDENDGEFDNLGAGDEVESESPENIVVCLDEVRTPNSDIVDNTNFNKDDRRRVVKKKAVSKGQKRVKMEENDGGLGVGDEGDTRLPKNIVSCSSVRTLNSDIVDNVNANKKNTTRVVRKNVVTEGLKRLEKENNEGEIEKSGVDIVNDNKEDKMGAEKKKAVTKQPKRVKKDEKDRELGSGRVGNEAVMERANTFEFQNSGSKIGNSSAEYDFNSNMDINVGKEEKMESVVTKGREKKDHLKELVIEEIDNEPKTESPKVKMHNEPKTESPKISVLGAIEFQSSSSDIANSSASMSKESEYDASGLVAVENVTGDSNNANKEEKTIRVVRKKVVKKVVTKVLKKVKMEQLFKEQGKLGESEPKSPNVIEFRNPNSDTAKSSFSNLSGDKNDRSEVDYMETEKANSIHDACENVNDNTNSNANKEENNVRVEKLESEGSEIMKVEKHQSESCDVSGEKREFTMVDDVILSAQMDALERRKRRRTQIFLGGLDKDALEEDVRKVFQKIGEIVELTMKMNNKTGKSKGFAFLRYASAADAKKAVESSGKIKIFGKQCIVEFMKGNDTIYLGNIDKTWKNDEIVRLLQDAGVDKIDKVTSKPDPEKPECNCGYAFLELETIRDAQITFGLLEKKRFLGNKKIRVEWAKQLSEADEEEMYKAKTVYAEYLPASWDEEAVKNHFKKFGEIESVALARNLAMSKRKDFAFVNYKTREAALTCIKAYASESSHDENSKVNIKVSLAKSTPKTKLVKHASTPVIKISKKEKPTTAQNVVQSSQPRNKAVSTSHYYDNKAVIQPQLRSKGESLSHHCDNTRASTNDELVQLLRAQASWRQPQTSSGIGSTGLDYTHSLPAMKRQYSLENPSYSDPRGYPRPRTDSAIPDLNPSVLYPDVRIQSLSHYHRQGLSHPSGLPYEVDGYFNSFQRRGGAASSGGESGEYRRY